MPRSASAARSCRVGSFRRAAPCAPPPRARAQACSAGLRAPARARAAAFRVPSLGLRRRRVLPASSSPRRRPRGGQPAPHSVAALRPRHRPRRRHGRSAHLLQLQSFILLRLLPRGRHASPNSAAPPHHSASRGDFIPRRPCARARSPSAHRSPTAACARPVRSSISRAASAASASASRRLRSATMRWRSTSARFSLSRIWLISRR